MSAPVPLGLREVTRNTPPQFPPSSHPLRSWIPSGCVFLLGRLNGIHMTVGPAILRTCGVRPCPTASHNSRHSLPADTFFQPPPPFRSAWLRFPAVPDTPGLGWLQGS